jgi:hypothetical protein
LFTGQIMDHERLPVLTLLAFAGVALLVWRWRKDRKNAAPATMLLLAGAGFFLLLLFGRPTWGALLTLLGATRDLHLHRVLGSLQIFLTLIAAVSLAALWRATAARWHYAGSAALTLVLIFPLVQERWTYIETHTEQGWVTYNGVKQAGATLDAAMAEATRRGGRVFAGLPGTWGANLVLGRTPVYAFLMTNLVPAVSVAYNVAALPSDLVPKFDQNHPLQYRIYNIRTVIAPRVSPPDFMQVIGDSGNYRLLAAPGGGYFDLVDIGGVAPVDRDSFYGVAEPWLRSPWAAAGRYIWLDFVGDAPKDLPRLGPGEFPEAPAPGGPLGSVSQERQTGQVYEADLDVQRPTYALFRMTYHPKWNVTVDGRPVKTAMVTPGFLAAPVTPGTHHIRAQYQPGMARTWMALAGLVIVAALLIFDSRRGARNPGAA